MSNDIWVGQLVPENANDERKVIEFASRFEQPCYGIYFYAKTPERDVAGYTRANQKGSVMSPGVSLSNVVAIDVLQVEPTMQRNGIARRLTDAVKYFTQEQGFDKIYILDSVNNSFWNHMGYEPVNDSPITFVKELE